MKTIEIVVIVVTVIVVLAIIGVMIFEKIKGKSCNGDCSNCKGCHYKKKK